ncbi:MAG: electron transport complex subunit RsxC [Ruminococcaceae bacterium]|nr:electron transport complex subunit RsxC [Oscillospiraceae bacterium]
MNISFLSNLKNFLPDNELKTFKGGVHPNDHKSPTNRIPILDIPAPEQVIIPLNQHIGAPAVPCVSVGDSVLAGQKIAQASGFISANVHSSVSGTVCAIEERMTPMGVMAMSIVIDNDGEDNNEFEDEPRNFKDFSPAELVDIIREAGIVGMGGATFPTHVKLSPPEGKKIDYVIVNGAECEPYLTSDHRAMLETPMEVITGLKIILRIFGLKTGYIAIENNKPDAINLLSDYAARENEFDIKIVPMKVKYPQGSEKQLIKAITGRSVPMGKLPMDVGAVVNNIDTCAAIARAVVYGIPLISRIVTVSGDAIKNPTNARVRIGTPFSYVIENSGTLKSHPKKVLMGGPMMGVAVPSLDVPIIKGSSGILALSKRKAYTRSEGICVRCGKCVSACPMQLMPLYLKEAATKDDFEKLTQLNISNCIECGSCSYICPGANNPAQSIKVAKFKLRTKK